MNDKTEREKGSNGSNSNASSESKPATPSANDLMRAQTKIVELIGEWPPAMQQRVLNACGVTLGVPLGPQRDAQQRPPANRNNNNSNTNAGRR